MDEQPDPPAPSASRPTDQALPARPRVAALPLDVVTGDVAANLDRVLAALEDGARDGVDLLVLPEMWPTSFTAGVDAALLASSDAALERVARRSAELGLLVAGSAYGPPDREGRPSNRLHLFEDGVDRLAYDKVHLFSPTAEPATFRAGDRPCPVVATRIGRVSGMVCYDLRFPELARVALRGGADLLVVPAQWPVARGVHWLRLAAARAIDAQCFLVAANRSGTAVIGRRELVLEFPGNACIVSPHGEELALGRGPERIDARLDLDQARELRRRVPLLRDERPELYARWLP